MDPADLHERARGVKGHFEAHRGGLRKLRKRGRGAARHLAGQHQHDGGEGRSTRFDSMVDVATKLGVDAIGLNHLMYSTTAERDETLALIGEDRPGDI